jgi:O-antigen ligase
LTRSAGAPQLLRLGVWAALVLSAAFFLTTGGTYPGIASVDAHVIGQVIGITVLGGWCALALMRPVWRPSSPLLLPVVIASAAYLLSAVFSQRPRLSFEPTIAGLGWALAYLFMARLLAEDWFRARVGVVMTAFVAVVAFGYIGQVLIEWWNWWGLVGRFAVPPLRPSFAALFLGSPNLIGTALMLLAPLVVAIAWSRYPRKSIAVALAASAALAVFVSGSRGAYLGVGVGAILAVMLALMRGGGLRSTVSPLVARARARPMLLLPVAVLGALVLVLAPSLILRFAQGGGTLRLDLWRSALSIFAEHPLFGAGPGTWVQLKVAANPEGVPNLILPQAHDMYVQAAAEVGVVGLVALAVLAVAVLRRLWAGWRSTDRALSLETGAVLVSLAAFLAQSIVDNLVNLPFILVILVAIVAWVDGGLAQTRSAGGNAVRRAVGRWLEATERGPIVPAVALVAIALVVPTLLRIDRAALIARDGAAAALRGEWQQALGAYDEARSTDAGFTLYELQTAGALARVGRLPDARSVLARAVEADPVAVNVIGLAALEAELGDRDSALSHVAQARALGIGEPLIALNAGLIAERFGERNLALEAFAQTVAWNPPLIRSDIWDSVERIATKEEVADEARVLVDDLEDALITAYAGNPAGAREALLAQPRSERRDIYLAVCDWREGDPGAAIERLGAMAEATPSGWIPAAWAARIAHQAGFSDPESRYAAWAVAVQADSASATIAEMSSVPSLGVDPSESQPLNYPWAVYLRPNYTYPVMPQVVVIGPK